MIARLLTYQMASLLWINLKSYLFLIANTSIDLKQTIAVAILF